MDKTQIFGQRIKKISRHLGPQGADALLVSRPANVTYVTGFMGDESWAVLAGRAVYLITDSRYTEQAAEQCPGCRVIERTEPMTKAVAQLLAKHRSIKSVAVENSISLAQLKALRKDVKVRIMPVAGVVETARRKKDSTEVRTIEKAAKIASKALTGAMKGLKTGISESEFAGLIELEMRRLGATASFDTIVAFGANASRPHHHSGNRKLRENGSVLIDFGAKFDGYCCDITRCFSVGKSGKLYEKAYKAVQASHDAAIAAVKAGVEVRKIDTIARGIISRAGFEPHGHGTGHGLGLEVHEPPVVGAKSKGKLQAGDVITIEPGIYIRRKFGIRIEDDILVTGTGHKILTRIPS